MQKMHIHSIEDLTRSAMRCAVHVGPDPVQPPATSRGAFRGQLLSVEVCDGLFATGHDIRYMADRRMAFQIGASLTCGILLDGRVQPMQVDGHAPVHQQSLRPVLVGFGHRATCHTDWRKDEHCRMGGFSLRPQFFDRFADILDGDALEGLQRFVTGDHCTATLPASPRLTTLAQGSLSHAYTGAMERLFLESNTLAMVIEVAHLLAGRRGLGDLSPAHARLLRQACERIDADLVNPPATAALAREVGTNVPTLQRAFRVGLGTTIFGHIQNRRLDMAQILLRQRIAPVAVIAERVGFRSAPAFSAAYRRRFGHPPTSER